MHSWKFGNWKPCVAATLLFVSTIGVAQKENADDTNKKTGVQLLQSQANDLKPLVKGAVGQDFLAAASNLPSVGQRTIYIDRNDSRKAISNLQAEKLDAEQLKKFDAKALDEQFYYFTRYGSPLAFALPLEILASKTDIKECDGLRIVDFGFGTIGHLRMLASQGADVTGIEVDLLLRSLYSEPSDFELNNESGKLELRFGKFPSELEDGIRGDVDLFVSKNTLKRGYIHPEKPVNPRFLVHLDVSDEQFLQSVHRKLKEGGYFLIYNLHPPAAAADEPYKPWADGRSPFSREDFEAAGFEVLAFDVDDSKAVRRIARALKWDQQMDLDKDLFGMYTLVRKSNRSR